MANYSQPLPKLVKIGNKYSFEDQTGRQITNRLFDQAREFSEGLAAVCLDIKWGYINPQGEIVISFQFGLAESFSEGLAAVGYIEEYKYIRRTYDDDDEVSWQDSTGYNKKYGYINQVGEIVIPIQYDEMATIFFQGVAGVGINAKTDKGGWRIYQNYFFINKKGEKISPIFSYLDESAFAEGLELASVQLDDKFGFVNRVGKIVIPIQFEKVSPFCGQLAYVRLNGKEGAIDKTGAVVIPFKFDSIYHESQNITDNGFSEGLLAVEVDHKWGYIDNNLTFIIPPQFDYANNFSEGLAKVGIDNKSGLINKKGQFFWTGNYKPDHEFTLKTVEDISGKYGYVNNQWQLVVPFQFDCADDFTTRDQELARVQIRNKWGYINQKGQIVIQPKFEEARQFDQNGKAQVQIRPMFLGIFAKDPEWVDIDKTGRIIKGGKINYVNLAVVILIGIIL